VPEFVPDGEHPASTPNAAVPKPATAAFLRKERLDREPFSISVFCLRFVMLTSLIQNPGMPEKSHWSCPGMSLLIVHGRQHMIVAVSLELVKRVYLHLPGLHLPGSR
jgi:hypothetical protein